MRRFVHESGLPADRETAFAWHARDGAFERLTPPWELVSVASRQGENLRPGTKVVFRVYNGPLPVTWVARHTDYEPPYMFRDEQVSGPFDHWRHTHRFSEAGGGCTLSDEIEYELPLAPAGPLLGGGMVEKKLARMFGWRHRTTAGDLDLHGRYPEFSGGHVMITGAGGMLGSILAPFLTTGGHRVTKMVRRVACSEDCEVRWEPLSGMVDTVGLPPVDAVVHLAGENIGEGRWTRDKKRRIVESRLVATRKLVRFLARMTPRPEVLVSASAVGYYGDRGDEVLDESAPAGDGFIPWLCEEWEKAAMEAQDAGIRVVCLRIGVVLSPAGGALKKLGGPARAGICPYMGDGGQYVGWVAPEDVLGAVLHCMADQGLSGPVNLTAPHPVTSRQLAQGLRNVLGRGLVTKVPAAAVRTAFGPMAEEVLLAGARVAPKKLLDSGYRFLYPELTPALAHNLGVAGS
ncbi:MAG: TIGR01777 family oxidoreductase [Desulfatibacillaceae bacterium]